MPSKEYFQRVACIAQYILKEGNKDGLWLEDTFESHIKYGPDSGRCVIPDDGSLLLEVHYGMPIKFHTPLGGFQFAGCGSGDFQKLINNLEIKLGLVEFIPQKQTFMGFIGPVYAVTKDLNGNSFLMPSSQKAKINFSYSEFKTEWDNLKPTLDAKKSKKDENEKVMEP